MRRFLILSAAAAVLFVLGGCTIQYYEDPNAYQDEDDAVYYEDEYEDDTGVVFDEFDDLRFWGQWVDLYPYGWVWRPTVVMGWRPYGNGHWIWTEYGWTWASYEPFGWATYHYGFWAYDVVWGWVWIPDYEWSPARVDWVVYDDYIAWAPLPPPGFRIGEPWNVTEIYVWYVVPASDFLRPDIGRYHVGYKENYRVRTRSTVKYKAPQVSYVEGRTDAVVRPVEILLTDRLTRGDRTIKGIRFPDTEMKRIDRYRERIEQKILDTDPPREREVRKGTRPVRDRDDRIAPPKREEGDTNVKPREERREPERKKEPAKKPPAKKKSGDKPVKQEPDTPAKQEPQKEPTKDTGKREPVKKKKG